MNKKLWDFYKESPRGKNSIALFDPDREDITKAAFDILKQSVSWGADSMEDSYIDELEGKFWLWTENFSLRNFIPEEWDKGSYVKFMEEYDILRPKITKDGELEVTEDNRPVLDETNIYLRKDQYRIKAAIISEMSLLLYYLFETFKPVLLPRRFDIIQRNCDALGLEMPPIPRSNDYKAYLEYYYDICVSWNEFQKDYELSDAELCACIYDFAEMLIEEKEVQNLPKPTNVWLTGADKGDYAFLDSLGATPDGNERGIWACNERTRRGDIIVLYCTTPRSCIHSIWRSNSGGFFNPFDYYHCRTTVVDGIKVSPISFKNLKEDTYMSKVPIVRRNLQGINGIELTSEDYANLLRMIQEKGGDISMLPQLFEGGAVDFGIIKLEKDVEENILIPMLKKLGYSENNWSRQLSLKAGRKEKAIPDFVFFSQGDKHFEKAPMVIEAKLDLAPIRELQKAFSQCLSYASMLHSPIMGICDKERLILYKADKQGNFDRNSPIFEEHWAAIYADPLIGARLNKLIGKEVIKDLKIL